MISFPRLFFSSSSSDLGRRGEELVAEKYRSSGYEIIARNYYRSKGLRRGEIDVIVKKGNELVFVEVKTRSTEAFGGPAYAISASKKNKLLIAAKQFISEQKQYERCNCRIDVALVSPLDNGEVSVTILENTVEDHSSS